MSHPVPPLVPFRHGHSEWNLTHRFTGWTDIALTEVGIAEAEAAGRALARAGYGFDEVHGSVLQRCRQTAEALLLAAMGTPNVPYHTGWRLNERHYGALQGLNKQEIFATWGEAASRRWWRGYVEAPPPLASDDPRHPRFDPRYAALDPADLPGSESLRDCQRRVLPYWHNVIVSRLRAGRRRNRTAPSACRSAGTRTTTCSRRRRARGRRRAGTSSRRGARRRPTPPAAS